MPQIHSQDHFTPKAFGGASPPNPQLLFFRLASLDSYTIFCQGNFGVMSGKCQGTFLWISGMNPDISIIQVS